MYWVVMRPAAVSSSKCSMKLGDLLRWLLRLHLGTRICSVRCVGMHVPQQVGGGVGIHLLHDVGGAVRIERFDRIETSASWDRSSSSVSAATPSSSVLEHRFALGRSEVFHDVGDVRGMQLGQAIDAKSSASHGARDRFR
jgi:hypothetical protein